MTVEAIQLANQIHARSQPARVESSHEPGFGDLLAQLGGGAIDALRGAETAAVGAIAGDVSVQQVAQAVMGAEQSLQTAIALRDKVVAAYLEIQRMPI
jgi:flagellar hook-basal body complex protein FliE